MTAEQGAKRAAKPALVRVKGLHKRYVHRPVFSRSEFAVDALKNVDLELQPECLTALLGASGSGKSTLALCLAMLEKSKARPKPMTGRAELPMKWRVTPRSRLGSSQTAESGYLKAKK